MPFLLLSLILIWTQAFAASPVWRVETGGQQLYIGGTVHLLRAADYPLPAAFDRAYADAQIVVFETSVSDKLTPEQQQAMLQATSLPGGQTIDEVLAAPTFKKLADHLEQNGLAPEAFNRMRPGMIALTLTLIELRRLGVTQIGVDQHYIQRSSGDNKPQFFLETLQQQIDYLAALDVGIENEIILQSLQDIQQLGSQFDAMMASWRRGDREAMYDLFVRAMRDDFPGVYRVLLVERNQAWLNQIDAFLRSPETELLLVGSAHLLGPDGLLEHMTSQGYRVIQLD